MEEKWNEVFNFLSLGIYPSGFDKSKRLNLRRYASKFTLKEGELFHGSRSRRVIKSKEDARELFKEFHSCPIGKRIGQLKTRSEMCSRLYWFGMTIDIDKWVLECDHCKKTGKPLTAAQPSQCIKAAKRPQADNEDTPAAWQEPLGKRKNGGAAANLVLDYLKKKNEDDERRHRESMAVHRETTAVLRQMLEILKK